MDADALKKNLRELKRERSFVPFAFVLKDGRRIEVLEPSFFGMGLSTVVVVDAQEFSVHFNAGDVVSLDLHQHAV